MNRKLLVLMALFNAAACYAESGIAPAPNGIELPKGYQNWRFIGSSQRRDNDTSRVILGNSIAIKAIAEQNTKPWPEGSVLVKLVWKDRKHPAWPKAIVPGEFVHSELMVKDSQKYTDTGGWGYARWKGVEQIPYGNDADFAQECYQCHKAVQNEDYVFTIPAQRPRQP